MHAHPVPPRSDRRAPAARWWPRLLAVAAVWLLAGCVQGSLDGGPGLDDDASDDDTGTADDDATSDDDTGDDDTGDDDTGDDDTADDDTADDDDSAASAAAALVATLTLEDYRGDISTLAGFGDRSVGSASYEQAEAWVEGELASMGYAVERHGFSYDGGTIDNLHATKVGALQPERMVIVSAHLDGRGGGGAADDDGSGSALVLAAARAFAPAEVVTSMSVRFVLWNAEETGLHGSSAYVADRNALQGIEDPPGSGAYPEPTWDAVIQSDMLLFDHGVPAGPDQIAGADVDVEFRAGTAAAAASEALAAELVSGCATHCAVYPAEVGDEMSNTDSVPFQDHAPTVSVRENRRLDEIGAGGNPHWHQPTDVPETYSDDDYRLGLDAVRMVVGTVAERVGASVTGP